MWIGIISLFPEMFQAITDWGVTSRAIKNGLLTIKKWNLRDFVQNQHCSIDGSPYGGGPGMVISAEPLYKAISIAKTNSGSKNTKVIYLSPQGKKIDQSIITKLVNANKLILVCGRYKGIDERVIQKEIDEEWSIGDYVLSGGELPAMVLIDSISRLIPGVLGNKSSISEDSFFNGLLGYPNYTRPNIIHGMKVPSVLLSGNHKKIKQWRMKKSLGRTWIRRPELLKKISLDEEQKKLLEEFKYEYKKTYRLKNN